MSTPICDQIGRAARVAACLLGCVIVPGCAGDIGFGGSVQAPSEVAVTADRIIVTGPEGYCVDPTATRDRGDTGFVLLGNCAAIANSGRALQPAIPAVLTAAVSAPSDGGNLADSLDELDSFFRSEDGLRLISRSGDPATVTVLDTAMEGDVFFLHATDTSVGAIDGVHSDYWRAYLDVGRRIATLSVIALEDRALTREESLATLRDFVLAVQAANLVEPDAPVAQVPPPAPDQTTPETLPPRTGPLYDVGIFRRILG